MKKFIIVIMISVFASCRGGENKADGSTRELEPKADTMKTPTQAADTSASTGQSRSIELIEPKDILASIDKHLVSIAKFKPVAGGGFTDCIVTVTNTLPDVSFQKALVEVNIKRDDSSLVRTDYYTVVNIGPGMLKQIKVPNNAQGSAVITTVVKVKSPELSNGEWALSGTPK